MNNQQQVEVLEKVIKGLQSELERANRARVQKIICRLVETKDTPTKTDSKSL